MSFTDPNEFAGTFFFMYDNVLDLFLFIFLSQTEPSNKIFPGDIEFKDICFLASSLEYDLIKKFNA